MTIAELRQEYTLQGLNEAEADPNPLTQFQHWFSQALEAKLHEPNAMTLATATRSGIPSARIVLLKGVDDRGFVFYTNYDSRKGQELTDNPHACLVFLWADLERQVRIEGTVTKISESESDAYFQSRPMGSRLGAWASEQSQVVTGRSVLEQRLAALKEQYEHQDIPRPSHWGGFRVIPHGIEFWQGRPNRLHDRLYYRLLAEGTWQRDRLSP